MTDPTDTNRLFSEKDISAILERAAELQQIENPTQTSGLSLTELQHIAAGAGIDPRHIATAVSELMDTENSNERPNFWGGPTSLTLERTVPGEIETDTWETIIAETRRAFQDTGRVSRREDTLEWQHSGRSSVRAHVTATPRNGRTRIQVFWHEPILAVPVYVPLLTLGLILIPVFFESLNMFNPAGVSLYIGVVSILFFLARWIVGRMVKKRKKMLHRLMSRLENVCTAEQTNQTIQEASPVITLDDAVDAVPGPMPKTRHRTRR